MDNSARAKRRVIAVAAMIVAGTVIAGCGSGSAGNSSVSGGSADSSHTRFQPQALNFARCMRSHRVSNFPDPTSNGGGFDVNVAGVNPSSPAFQAAQTACRQLLPVKRPQSGPPSPRAYTRLLDWASCMRTHGISGLPDPKPDPPPSPASPEANLYGTLMGDGGYWIGIPSSVNAHSASFIHLATVCGESPNGHHG